MRGHAWHVCLGMAARSGVGAVQRAALPRHVQRPWAPLAEYTGGTGERACAILEFTEPQGTLNLKGGGVSEGRGTFGEDNKPSGLDVNALRRHVQRPGALLAEYTGGTSEGQAASCHCQGPIGPCTHAKLRLCIKTATTAGVPRQQACHDSRRAFCLQIYKTHGPNGFVCFATALIGPDPVTLLLLDPCSHLQ